MMLTAYIGTVAAFCTTMAFVPQIVKLRKQGGEDLSYQMLFLYLTGVLLWLVYGIRVHALAVIWANALACLMVLTSIVLKANPPAKKVNSGSRSSGLRKVELPQLELQNTESNSAGSFNSKFQNPESPKFESLKPAASGLPSRRLRIAVDMDEVIADSFGKQLDCYNQRTGANLTREMISSQGLTALIPPDRWDEFAGIPHEDGFFADLELIEGSGEALRELSRDHEVYIASAAMEVPSSFAAKYKWLQQHFAFIPSSRIVFCGDKNIIHADVLVDDRSRHFREFRGTGILFTAPHNATETAHLRAHTWNDVMRILGAGQSEVVEVEKLARTFSMNPAG